MTTTDRAVTPGGEAGGTARTNLPPSGRRNHPASAGGRMGGASGGLAPNGALAEGVPAGALTITVHGAPATQGSKTKTKYGLIDDNAKTLKPWRKAVARDAALAFALAGRPTDGDGHPEPLTGPVCVEATISLSRPAHHYRTGRYAHLLRDDAPDWPIARGVGDSDKFLRAICDAMTTAHVWTDDVLVVEATVRKVFVCCGIDALDRPGAVIRIWPLGGAT